MRLQSTHGEILEIVDIQGTHSSLNFTLSGKRNAAMNEIILRLIDVRWVWLFSRFGHFKTRGLFV